MASRVEESERERIDRLGRERPLQFKTAFAEVCFVYSLLASQFMAEYFVSGFNLLIPTLIADLNIPPASAVWPAGAFALVTAAFLLPCGRFADMYGGYPIYMAGLIWFTIWSVIAGFSRNELMLDVSRAMAGLGPAAFLPSGVMLMAKGYRPGPRKNLVFGLYGGSAPLGFFFGIFIAGLTGSFLRFGWYFWIGALLTLSTAVTAFLTLPNDSVEQRQKGVQMDWVGAALITSGLILVVFAVTDSSGAPDGWRTPYIPSTLLAGLLLLALAVYVEGWIAHSPLIPFDLFAVPYLKPLFVALFFSYGTLGVFLFYATLYMQDIMGASPLLVSAWYAPMSLIGILISVSGGYFLHLVPGTVLLPVSAAGWIITSLLFATAPDPASYWAVVFPAMICATIGIDLTFNTTNVFITTHLSSKRQGLAGALINSLLYLGIAVLIAFADLVQTSTAASTTTTTTTTSSSATLETNTTAMPNTRAARRRGYKSVFWYQFACSLTTLLILLVFVRVKRAQSDFTVDEKEAATAAAAAAAAATTTASRSLQEQEQEQGPGHTTAQTAERTMEQELARHGTDGKNTKRST
ncbi:MAG: hypothetical protein M1838_003942 [Thelocarpon superellum]|nr:MAG: hypothetical protein M1838_003942 [Thelocarpon superellum]